MGIGYSLMPLVLYQSVELSLTLFFFFVFDCLFAVCLRTLFATENRLPPRTHASPNILTIGTRLFDALITIETVGGLGINGIVR